MLGLVTHFHLPRLNICTTAFAFSIDNVVFLVKSGGFTNVHANLMHWEHTAWPVCQIHSPS
uniref:Uncharacterized protein n=1 Tax=Anguilla anguilla TaxID=7936 RepID=A0A0E9XFG0_ANGAN